MNVENRKNFWCSGSDKCSELYTVCREETRSDSTSKERQPFCNIILIKNFRSHFNIEANNSESLEHF